MTSDIGKAIGILFGKPVLEVGISIVPLLKKNGSPQTELSKVSFLIAAPGHQRAVVKTLVIFHCHQQISLFCLSLNLF